MKELLQLNKKYLFKLYLWISGISTIGFLVLLFFFYKEINWNWITINLFSTLFFIPLLLLFLSVVDAYENRKYIKKICSNKPYSDLSIIGFNHKKLMPISVNGLKDNVLFRIKDDIPIFLTVNNKKPKVIELLIYCDISNLNGRQYILKSEELATKNIDLNFASITKRIDTKREKMTLQTIEMMLNELVHIVKMNKFEVYST